jgi:hypothetical protein
MLARAPGCSPGLPANLVECLGGPLGDVEWVQADLGLGGSFNHRVVDPFGTVG